MRVTKNIAVLSAASALALAMAACGTDDGNGTTDTVPDAAPTEMTEMGDDTTGTMNGTDEMEMETRDGVTTVDDVFGEACGAVPQDPSDPGSLDGMVADPVATAASNNPLLQTLATAVAEAGLVDTLNDPSAEYTVFAPTDDAFDALGEETLNAVLADQEQLTAILTYHVISERHDRDAILEAGELETIQGETLTIGGSGDDVTVNEASVLCGNIPTANATVFVIDTVLLPPEE
ncbi:fasciclin domain-containing protein [Hoyosella sp. YIM 151337]|uniref:fasciclin domain-containing protein n=1 Tax=Hoyosella sp. YIM 151337 TaxID=2992742 RepID=UPI002236B3B7|nr:fasciclin domain-containing protein [Hoyosella sp. YIM 151337]MCW4355790.1 fasciclin domain-containing protein [Hoyosella sp. YIM 151337]